MLDRRTLLTAGTAGTLALTAAACGDGGTTDPTDTEANAGKTLTLWIMEGTNADADAYIEELKTAFTDLTGADLTVEVQPWDGAHDKFVTAMTGGTGPDVAEVGTTWTPEFADAGGLSDLTDDIEAAGLADGLVQGLVDAGTLDGVTYGMPWYAGVRAILGDAEILERAGVNRQPESWDDLLAMIEAIQESDPDTIAFPVPGAAMFSMVPFIWGAGGDIATEADGQWTAAIDQPEAVEGLSWYVGLAQDHDSSTAAASTWTETDALASFEQGQIAMFITGSWVPATIQQDVPELYDRLVAYTVPAKDSPVADAFLGGSHLCRFESCEEPELAFELIQLMATGDFATRWAQETNYFPGQTEALQTVVDEGGDLMAPFAQAMEEGGRSVPVTPLWGKIEGRKTIPNLLNSILAEGQDVQTACDAAAAEMDEIFQD